MNAFKINELQKKLCDENIEGAFFFSPKDIFYFTQSFIGILLYIPKKGTPFLFIKKAFERAKKDLALKNIPLKLFKNFKSLKEHLPLLQPADAFTLPLDTTPFTLVEKLLATFDLSIKNIVNFSSLFPSLGIQKTPEEILAIEEAGNILSESFKKLTKTTTKDKTEWEVSCFLQNSINLDKGSSLEQFRSFNHTITPPLVLTQESLLKPSYNDTVYGGKGLKGLRNIGSSNQILSQNFPFIVDMVAHTKGYYSDITRTFVIGEPSALLKKRYEDLLTIFEFTKNLLKSGNLCSFIYEQTLNFVDQMGYKDNFMGLANSQVKFIGHGIGLYVDEFPAISAQSHILLKENMVIALEPKLFFEDFLCVGIENTFLITQDKPKSLTPLSDELIILKEDTNV